MGILDRKEVLGMMTYGVYVLTTKVKDKYSAATVTWVSQASFDPPMISVCLKRNSGAYSLVKEKKEFILHMLSEEQKDVASNFFTSTELEDDKLNGETFKLIDGLPVLNVAPSYVHCSVLEILEIGDHPLFLCEVDSVNLKNIVKPLELRRTGWKYGG
ncbi:MAG: flavin reductase family protein [Candidatus Neomarinimicrobiota bacterium]|nr:flavin reductase family protein [Candidatus Neomarinimicrobiota bacterium]